MAKFTASHGVAFDDLGIQFKFDAVATGNSQTKVYAADLSAADAKKLTDLPADVRKQYGITKAEDDESQGVTIPDGDPTDKWKGPELKAYADREGIDLKGATKNADVLAAITAAKSA